MGPARAAQRRQVLAARGADARPPRDRGVPVHDPPPAARDDGVRGRAGAARRHAGGGAGARRELAPGLAHGADGILLVLDVTADDLEASWSALLELLERAHVWPRGRPPPADASPLVVERPVLVLANKIDLDGDGTFSALAREGVGQEWPFLRSRRRPARDSPRSGRSSSESWGASASTRASRGRSRTPARPFVLPAGATVEDLARLVHLDLASHLKFARIWGERAVRRAAGGSPPRARRR